MKTAGKDRKGNWYMNKRTWIVVLAALVVTLAACGGKNKSPEQELAEISIENGYSAEQIIAAMDAARNGESPMAAAKAAAPAVKKTAAAAEKEQDAAALPVNEADFTVDVTQDGKGIIITGYKGIETVVRIPASYQGMPVRVIGNSAFKENKTITSVVIPQGVTKIGSRVFWYCTSLASVTIPNSVTEIGRWAFEDCTSLASITIPNGVTAIGDSASAGCTSLASVTISPIKRRFDRDSFDNCPKLNLASQAALRAAGYTDGFN
jgi:hypothetical protein